MEYGAGISGGFVGDGGDPPSEGVEKVKGKEEEDQDTPGFCDFGALWHRTLC